RGDRDHTFTTGSTCVIAEKQVAKEANTTSCNTAETLTAATTQITVPAGGTTTIDYTLTPDTTTRHWTQGWATLNSADDTQPDLVVPYLGFVGDWNAEPIIDHPEESGKTPVLDGILGPDQANHTELYGPLGNVETSTQWLSPNGDGFFDELFPLYMMLRSAAEVRFEVVKDGTVVRTFGKERNVTRLPLALLPPAIQSAAEGATNQAWDGTLYNPATGEFETVPDADLGTYHYRIQARLSEEFEWQTTELSIGVDTVAPEASYTVTTGADGSRTYTVKATDDRSGLDNPAGVFARDAATGTVFEPTLTDVYTFTVPTEVASSDSYVEILAMDQAGNSTQLRDFYRTKPVRVLNSHRLDRWIGKESVPFLIPEISDGKAVVELITSPEVDRVTFNGTPVEITDGQARVLVPLTPGRSELAFVAYSNTGQELGTATHWIGYDETPPDLQITSAPVNAAGQLEPGPDGTITVTGRVTDDLAPAGELVLLDNGVTEVPLDDQGNFSYTITPTESQSFLVLVALDHASTYRKVEDYANSTSKAWSISGRANPVGLHILFDDPELRGGRFGQPAYLVSPDFQDLEIINQDAGPGEIASRLTLKGRLSEAPASFEVDGKPVQLDDQQRFSIPLDLRNAINKVGYVAVSKGGERIEGSWRFVHDRALPGIDLTIDPRIHADGAIYLTQQPADIALSGEVWDNEFGYRLSVNGNVIEEFTNMWDAGADNRRPFQTRVPAARGGDSMLLSLMDEIGNGFERRVPVVLDDTAPEVSIDGPKDRVSRTAEFAITGTDENLEGLVVHLDGQQVAAEVVEVHAHPEASYTEFRQRVAMASTDSSAARETSKQVTVRLGDVKDLAPGRHALTAVATDKAGNTAAAASAFVLDEAPTITGPDALTIEPGKDPRQVIRENYQATDP
ncbi:Fn3-like domain-containing protein, partial [Arachnia propionica]